MALQSLMFLSTSHCRRTLQTVAFNNLNGYSQWFTYYWEGRVPMYAFTYMPARISKWQVLSWYVYALFSPSANCPGPFSTQLNLKVRLNWKYKHLCTCLMDAYSAFERDTMNSFSLPCSSIEYWRTNTSFKQEAKETSVYVHIPCPTIQFITWNICINCWYVCSRV